MDIKKLVTSKILKGLNKLAKEQELSPEKVQILITSDGNPNGGVRYTLIANNTIVRQLEYEEVIGVKMDMLNSEGMVSGVIQNSLVTMSKTEEIPLGDIGYMIVSKEEKLYYFLFNKFTRLKQVALDEVISF